MATCCKSNSTFLIFAVLVVWCDVGRVAVKQCFKLLSFLHLLKKKVQMLRVTNVQKERITINNSSICLCRGNPST